MTLLGVLGLRPSTLLISVFGHSVKVTRLAGDAPGRSVIVDCKGALCPKGAAFARRAKTRIGFRLLAGTFWTAVCTGPRSSGRKAPTNCKPVSALAAKLVPRSCDSCSEFEGGTE